MANPHLPPGAAENARHQQLEGDLKAVPHLPLPPPTASPVDSFSVSGSLSLPAPGELGRTSQPLPSVNSDPIATAVSTAAPADPFRR